MGKYRIMSTTGIILEIIGIVFLMVMTGALPIEEDKLGALITSLNTKFNYLGVAMIVGGAILYFYGRYKRSKEEGMHIKHRTIKR